jgi:hypothetical protein
MTELACKEVVFHFNKAHLSDPSIPMWVLKAKGNTYYVNHVTCDVPWNTKETPDNSHTKGAIKVKQVLLTIDDQNEARLVALTPDVQARLENHKEPIRVGWIWAQNELVTQLLQDLQAEHSKIKWLSSGCSTGYYVCDIYDSDLLIQLKLTVPGGFRQFSSNEWQFTDYGLEEEEEEDD